MSIGRYIYRPMKRHHRSFGSPVATRSSTSTVRPVASRLRQATLIEIERECGAALPAQLLAAPRSGTNSRDRIYPLSRTFWCFLWQVLQHMTSCREVVRQVQALFLSVNGGQVDEGTAGYCQARQRIPLSMLQAAVTATAASSDCAGPSRGRSLQGRSVTVVDGTFVELPDTPHNQKEYPQMANQKPGCGFPLMKVVALFSLHSGAILTQHVGNKHLGERQGLQACRSAMKKDDILMGDRQFGNFVVAAWTKEMGMDLIARVSTRTRHISFRNGKRLGHDDRQMIWQKSDHKPPGFTYDQWKALPDELMVRIIRCRVSRRGFRTHEITLITTLLDPVAYPIGEILETYLRRWELELCFDDLKTTLGMSVLRCRTPAMAEKELLAFLIAHNLLRWIIATAAKQENADPRRMSFKGTLDALRQFQIAMVQARTRKGRRALWFGFLRIIAKDRVPLRPNRREPRAVKRRIKYPKLWIHRHIQGDRPPRHVRRGRSRRRAI